jgi:hypothetical protein
VDSWLPLAKHHLRLWLPLCEPERALRQQSEQTIAADEIRYADLALRRDDRIDAKAATMSVQSCPLTLLLADIMGSAPRPVSLALIRSSLWRACPWCADHGPSPPRTLRSQAGARRDHRWPAVMDSVDDLSCVDALEVDRRDPEVRMPELPLDDRQRDPFVRHLDRMSMSELVRREPPPHRSLGRESAKLTARGGC